MNRTQLALLVFGLLVLGTILSVFLRQPQKNIEVGKVNVIVSFYPLEYIATSVGGQHVFVQNLLPPGGEPHDFDPSPRQLASIGESDLFIFNGGYFEPWIEKLRKGTFGQASQTINMVNELATRGAVLLTRNNAADPHVWLDPLLFKQEIEVIRDALIRVDPAHESEYRANAERLIVDIMYVDERFLGGLTGCQKQDIIVSHDAFGYLARRYNFSTIPISGISPDEEPSPKDLVKIADLAHAKNINYVFFETNVSPKLSEVIAREVGAETLVLNPLESLTDYELQSGEQYNTIMERNLNNLRKALVCQ